jgi:hypothetical protein
MGSISDWGFRIADFAGGHLNQPATFRRFAGRFQKCDAAGFDDFFPANGAGTFARLGFEANLKRAQTQDARDAMANGVLVIRQFWPLRVNDAIEVHNGKARLGNLGSGGGQHFGRIAGKIGRIGVREQAANIGQGSGAQEGIGYRVEQHIRIAVTDKLSVVGHIDAAQPQRPAGSSAVRIFANANAQIARGANSHTVQGNPETLRGLYPCDSKKLNGNRNSLFCRFGQSHVNLRTVV